MIAKIWFINRPVQIKNNSQSVYSFSSPSFMDLHILFMKGRTSISQSDDLIHPIIHPFTFWCTKITINTCCHMNDGCLFKVVYSFNSAFLFHHESKVSLITDKYEWKRLCIITTSLDVWDEQRVVTVRNEGNPVLLDDRRRKREIVEWTNTTWRLKHDWRFCHQISSMKKKLCS